MKSRRIAALSAFLIALAGLSADAGEAGGGVERKMEVWEVGLASDARFRASSGKILTPEEEAAKAAKEVLEGEKKDVRALETVKKDTNVRPGGLVYLQVIDPDQSISEKKDTVSVRVHATSGDVETVTLTETEPFSGMFRGQVRSALKPADCQASDSSEGIDPSIVISKAYRGKPWVALPDKKPGKWFQVDLKNILPVARVDISTGDDEGRAVLAWTLDSSIDGEEWTTIAAYPAGSFAAPGSATMAVYGNRGRGNTVSVTPAAKTEANGVWRPGDGNWPTPTTVGRALKFFGNRKDNFRAVISGKFVPSTGLYEFRVNADDRGSFYVDGEHVVDKGGTAVLDLEDGVHTFQLAWEEDGGGENVSVEYRSPPEKGNWQQLPAAWFDPGQHPEIGGDFKPPVVTPEGTAKIQDGDGPAKTGVGGWKIEFPNAVKTRIMRFNIDEYSGDAPTFKNLEVYNALKEVVVPTDVDVTKLKGNSVLEMTPGDEIVCTYKDVLNEKDAGGPYDYDQTLSAQYYNGKIHALHMVFDPERRQAYKYPLRRFNGGERLFVEVIEFDADLTPERDRVPVVVRSKNGKDEVRLEAIESEPRTGIFHVEVDTALGEKPNDKTLRVTDGDEVTILYRDTENTDPGAPFDRESVVSEAETSDPQIRALESRMQINRDGKRVAVVLDPEGWATPDGKAKRVALGAPLTVEVLHPEKALHAASSIPVWVEAETGDKVALMLEITGSNYNVRDSQSIDRIREALEEGIFRGKIYLQLGNPGDPREAVITHDPNEGVFSFSGDAAPKSSKSRSSRSSSSGQEESKSLMGVEVAEVLNVSGGDTIYIRYDPLLGKKDGQADGAAPEGDGTALSEKTVADKARIITDAVADFTESEYKEPVEGIQLGDKLYVRVVDADADSTEKEDEIAMVLTTDKGEQEALTLRETLPHSGIFTGSFPTYFVGEGKAKTEPVKNNNRIEVDFGDALTGTYSDVTNTASADPVEQTAKGVVSIGADAAVAAFAKRYSSPKVAVKTQLNIAEAYFELAKQHRDLKRPKLAEEEIRTGRQILREAVKDYPDTEYAVQALYLLANLDEENKNYEDAIDQYRELLRRWPDSEYAPHANYKMALSYEKLGDFDRASEEYVAVAYRWPEHELVGSVILRLGKYFFDRKEYLKAADVFIKLPERFPEHELSEKAFLQVSQCYGLAGEWCDAAAHSEGFLEKYGKSELRAQALYWAGYSYMKCRGADATLKAYKNLKLCVWEYPESVWAKYARRLLLDKAFERVEE